MSSGTPEKDDATENYYAEVEKHFVGLRGSPLFVSPAEWQLIHRWREAQIPLRVVKEGLDRAFANTRSRRPIRRLSYCRQTVEASYRHFREAIAGGDTARGASRGPAHENSDVRDYLQQLAAALVSVRKRGNGSGSKLGEAIDRAAKRLSELGEIDPVRLEDLESELEQLDTALVSAAESGLDSETRQACRDAAERSLRDYRSRMPDDVYTSALQSAYLKRVRAHFGLPAVSLFYI